MFAVIVGIIGMLFFGYVLLDITNEEYSTKKLAIILSLVFCILLIIFGCNSENNTSINSRGRLFSQSTTVKKNSTMLSP
ncbi:MAG: hypothetical protein RR239_01485 [Oscillospiraceae bacterium]